MIEKMLGRKPNIVNMEYGSKLYKTDTPESDTDYAGIYMPTMVEILLQNGDDSHGKSTGKAHQKNKSDDCDVALFSLHAFVRLCLSGDTTALDMLHCDDPLDSHWIFEELRSKRKMFYTRQMKAYVGFVKNQAYKYGVKGDKVNELRTSLDYLYGLPETPTDAQLMEVLNGLPVGEYITKETVKREGHPDERFYVVIGKKYQDTNTIKYTTERLQKKLDSYGERANIAAENNGMDWKAIHHSLRVLYQTRAILEYGDFHYPLAETEFLMRVKRGDVNYLEEVAPEFDKFLDEFDSMAEASDLPEEADEKYWNDWLVGVYDVYFNINYNREV